MQRTGSLGIIKGLTRWRPCFKAQGCSLLNFNLQICCVKRMVHSSYKSRPSTFSNTAPTRPSSRKWNVPRPVQQGLRNAVFFGPEFQRTIFKLEYPLPELSIGNETLKNVFGLESKRLEAALDAMSDQELYALVERLAVSGIHDQFHPRTRTVLSEVCISMLPRFALEEQLRLTDILYNIECISDDYMVMFYQYLVTNWKNLPLGNSHILQILFYTGVYRSAPAILLEKIEAYLAERGHELNGQQIGLVCHSFFACNRAIYNYKILHMISKVTLRDIKDMTLQNICNVLKVMRQADFNHSGFYSEMATGLCDSQLIETTKSLPALSNIASAYSAARNNQPALFAAIANRFCQLVSRSDEARIPRIKDLGRLLWSYQSLQQSAPDVLLDELERQADFSTELLRDYPEAYTQSVLALSMVNRFPFKAINSIFSPRSMDQRRNRSLEQIHQLLMLNSIVALSCPDYSGHLLSSQHVRMLRGERDSKLELGLQTRQGLAATWLTLEDLLGGADKICCHYITDFTFIPDLEMQIDGKGRPGTVSRLQKHIVEKGLKDHLREKHSVTYPSLSEEGVLAQLLIEKERANCRLDAQEIHLQPLKSSGSSRRVTIKVLSEKQYLSNEPTLLGAHQLELQFLRKLGYEVLVITPRDATDIEKEPPESRPMKVEKLILEKLGVKLGA